MPASWPPTIDFPERRHSTDLFLRFFKKPNNLCRFYVFFFQSTLQLYLPPLERSITPCVSPSPSSQGSTPTNTRVSTSPLSASTSSAHSGHGSSPCSLRTLHRTPSPSSASVLSSPMSAPSYFLTRCTRGQHFLPGCIFLLRLGFSRTRVWMRLMESKLGGQGWPVPWERCLTMGVVGIMFSF